MMREYSSNFFGKGFIGDGKNNHKNSKKEYILWVNMLERCYCKNYQNRNSAYKNVTVDPSWYNFQIFCEDIKNISGYNEWKNSKKAREYCLDKDILCDKLNFKYKIYSKNTCQFILTKTNASYVGGTSIKYELIAYNTKSNKYYNVKSIKDFCEKFKLSKSSVNSIIRKRKNIHKGWIFYKKEEELKKFYLKIYKAININNGNIEYFYKQADFANKYNLKRAHVSRVIAGVRPTVRGWKIALLKTIELDYIEYFKLLENNSFLQVF